MSDSISPNSDEVEELLDAYICHLEGDGDRPDLAGLQPDMAAEASEFFGCSTLLGRAISTFPRSIKIP